MTVRVLVVDDEPDVELLFRQQFRREMRQGLYTLDFAESGKAALDKLAPREGEDIVLMVSDINMPGMSGLDLLPVVKERRPDLPVFMISAYGDSGTVETALERGASKFLTKPVDFPQLKHDVSLAIADARGGWMTARILVVDDEPDLQMLIVQRFRRQIRDGSLSFAFAHDGVEALDAVAAGPDVDMVVSDINMPRMDGLTLLAKLQEREDNLATVIVSAYGDMANIRTAMNLGAFDFLTKPIDFGDLETTISKTLRNLEINRGYQRRQQEAEKARAQLARYFSPSLAGQLAQSSDSVDLGAQRREITSMFTDITGFTTLAETLEPNQIGPLLNEYLTGMTEIVFDHGGTLVKIIGDALNVLFGAPAEQPDHAARAVTCAMALDAYAQDFQSRWRTLGVPFGTTRIGVNTGPALVGSFGGGRFFDYTAYGDTINIAARLEAANKQLGTRVCVSGGVVDRIPDFLGRPVGHVILRGRTEPIPAYEPLTQVRHADPLTAAYRDAYAKVEARDPTAIPAFAALLGQASGDGLVSFHLKRVLAGASGVVMTLD